MGDLGRSGAVGGVGANGRGDPDRWDDGTVNADWWWERDASWGWGWGWLWLAFGQSTWAVNDGEGLLGGCGVCLGTVGDGSGLWAVSDIAVDSDGLVDDGVVRVSTSASNEAGLGCGEESEDGEECLNSLHFGG